MASSDLRIEIRDFMGVPERDCWRMCPSDKDSSSKNPKSLTLKTYNREGGQRKSNPTGSIHSHPKGRHASKSVPGTPSICISTCNPMEPGDDERQGDAPSKAKPFWLPNLGIMDELVADGKSESPSQKVPHEQNDSISEYPSGSPHDSDHDSQDPTSQEKDQQRDSDNFGDILDEPDHCPICFLEFNESMSPEDHGRQMCTASKQVDPLTRHLLDEYKQQPAIMKALEPVC